jgi:hypothetical protein
MDRVLYDCMTMHLMQCISLLHSHFFIHCMKTEFVPVLACRGQVFVILGHKLRFLLCRRGKSLESLVELMYVERENRVD